MRRCNLMWIMQQVIVCVWLAPLPPIPYDAKSLFEIPPLVFPVLELPHFSTVSSLPSHSSHPFSSGSSNSSGDCRVQLCLKIWVNFWHTVFQFPGLSTLICKCFWPKKVMSTKKWDYVGYNLSHISINHSTSNYLTHGQSTI